MMEWLKQHISIVVIIVIAITLLLPLGINAAYLVETDCSILHKPSEWTTFWGSYLGSIISAGVAFIILYIQRKDNEKQNDENRISNEVQNFANRELQYSIIRYQQERSCYDGLCDAGVENICAYKITDILYYLISLATFDITKIKSLDDFKPYLLKISASSDRLDKTNSMMVLLINRDSDEAKEYHSKRNDAYNRFQTLLEDVKILVTCSISNDINGLKNTISNESLVLSSIASEMINGYIKRSNDIFKPMSFMSDVIIPRIRAEENLHKKVQEFTYKYIQSEKQRIDNLLNEEFECNSGSDNDS